MKTKACWCKFNVLKTTELSFSSLTQQILLGVDSINVNLVEYTIDRLVSFIGK